MVVRTHSGNTPVNGAQNELTSQVDRILASEAFRGSETLRKLLEYLAGRAREGSSHSIRAKEVAASVFGRTSDFDPQNDSIVRVHAGRLRSKLAEYYVSEGSNDPVVVTIPKGSYDLVVQHRTTAEVIVEPGPATQPLPLPSRLALFRSPRFLWQLAIAAIAASVLWGGATVVRRAATRPHVTPALATFWHSFLADGDRALIVYSNLKVRAMESDRTLLLPSNGELLSVFQLTRFFTSVQKPVYPKHGPMLAWDEAKDVDLVFVGGPLAETPLRVLPTFHDFAFRVETEPERVGVIDNLRPKPGELAVYRGGPTPKQFDYSLIAMSTTFSPRHRVVTLAGITGYGTQGSAEFVTRDDRVQELLSRLGTKDGEWMPPFEAVLRFNVQGEIAIQPEIMAVHRLK